MVPTSTVKEYGTNRLLRNNASSGSRQVSTTLVVLENTTTTTSMPDNEARREAVEHRVEAIAGTCTSFIISNEDKQGASTATELVASKQ